MPAASELLAVSELPAVSRRLAAPDHQVAGLLLAAGAGSRYGMPKALVTTGGEPWVARGARVLQAAGCSPTMVVLGAAAEAARPLVPLGSTVLMNPDWETGMGSSLQVGLARCLLLPPRVAAVVILLVDLPGITGPVVGHFIQQVAGPLPTALAQASFDGVIGHPVLLGRSHWAAIAQSVGGDVGARPYLAEHGCDLIELSHLADGSDQDTPPSPGQAE